MTRDLKYLTLGVGFLAAMLFSIVERLELLLLLLYMALLKQMEVVVVHLSEAVAQLAVVLTSTAITNAQMHLAQAMTALQNKNTVGAMMQLKLLNQSLSTLSTGAGGVATSGDIAGPGPSTVNPGPGPSGSPSSGYSGPGPSTVNPGPGPSGSPSGGSIWSWSISTALAQALVVWYFWRWWAWWYSLVPCLYWIKQ